MLSYRYRFRQGGWSRALVFIRASDALYSAISHLHEHDAEPVAIERDGQLLFDPALIERVYRACRPDLEHDSWTVPQALERLSAREDATVAKGANAVPRSGTIGEGVWDARTLRHDGRSPTPPLLEQRPDLRILQA
jgi:hypothetical protein